VYLLESRSQIRMPIEEISQVGDCRRAAQLLAQTYDFDETLVGRVGIVATELTNNLVKHAGRGELLLQAISDGHSVAVEMLAIDRGPGMSVERCMRDGYSTTGTAGTGLGAISRLSTLFDLYSAEGQGTVAVSRVAHSAGTARQKTSAAPEFGAISIAVLGETECGDIWRIASLDGSTAILVADGLGHGPLAATAARTAAAAFDKQPFDSPSESMKHLHQALSGGRGAAAACAVIDAAGAKLTYSGVGNICGSVVSAERSRGMVSHNGILGVQLPRTQQFEYPCTPSDRVVMHSDGMSARWSLQTYPGLFSRHAAVIAGVLYRDHARPRDDVTVVVSSIRQ
jgi:anti-sigma regulatory factor (Ser/Thr protein kinase)